MTETLPALDNPRPTREVKEEQFRQSLRRRPDPRDQEGRPDTVDIPGVDVGELRRLYGPEQGYMPHVFTGTFQAPLGVSPAMYAGIRDAAATKFVRVMDKKGYDLVAKYRIQVEPGMYPAYDLASGVYLLDRREMLIKAHFTFRKPKVRTIELPPHILRPMTVRQ